MFSRIQETKRASIFIQSLLCAKPYVEQLTEFLNTHEVFEY